MSHIEIKSGEEQLDFRSKNYKLHQKNLYAAGLMKRLNIAPKGFLLLNGGIDSKTNEYNI